MKRITALLVVAALAISMFPLAAFAKSEAQEGMYGGYYYTASLTSTKSSATTRMTYVGSTKILTRGTINYKNTTTGLAGSMSLAAPRQASSTSKTQPVPANNNITYVSQDYCVSTTRVTTIAFNVT